MFGDPDTTPGGKALAFYASQRLGITRGKQIKLNIKGKERRVGNYSHMRVIKNKVAPPSEGLSSMEVFFNDKYVDRVGFNPYSGLADILQDSGVIDRKKGSSHYYFKGKVIANGEEAFKLVLEKNDKLRSKLIRKCGINTVEKTKKKLSSIDKNLYPVQ